MIASEEIYKWQSHLMSINQEEIEVTVPLKKEKLTSGKVDGIINGATSKLELKFT